MRTNCRTRCLYLGDRQASTVKVTALIITIVLINGLIRQVFFTTYERFVLSDCIIHTAIYVGSVSQCAKRHEVALLAQSYSNGYEIFQFIYRTIVADCYYHSDTRGSAEQTTKWPT